MPNFRLNQEIYNTIEEGRKNNQITQAKYNSTLAKINSLESIGAKNGLTAKLNLIPIVG